MRTTQKSGSNLSEAAKACLAMRKQALNSMGQMLDFCAKAGFQVLQIYVKRSRLLLGSALILERFMTKYQITVCQSFPAAFRYRDNRRRPGLLYQLAAPACLHSQLRDIASCADDRVHQVTGSIEARVGLSKVPVIAFLRPVYFRIVLANFVLLDDGAATIVSSTAALSRIIKHLVAQERRLFRRSGASAYWL